MKKYSVILRGENYELIFDGKVNNYGFYTTMVVKAISPEMAKEKAIELIKSDNNLLEYLQQNSCLEPAIYFESITKAPWWRRVGGNGYSFWLMASE